VDVIIQTYVCKFCSSKEEVYSYSHDEIEKENEYGYVECECYSCEEMISSLLFELLNSIANL
jgi:hypothetical protein